MQNEFLVYCEILKWSSTAFECPPPLYVELQSWQLTGFVIRRQDRRILNARNKRVTDRWEALLNLIYLTTFLFLENSSSFKYFIYLTSFLFSENSSSSSSLLDLSYSVLAQGFSFFTWFTTATVASSNPS